MSHIATFPPGPRETFSREFGRGHQSTAASAFQRRRTLAAVRRIMLRNEEELVNGECLYCGKQGRLDSRGACEGCIKDAYYREEQEAELFAGDWDDAPREEE